VNLAYLQWQSEKMNIKTVCLLLPNVKRLL